MKIEKHFEPMKVKKQYSYMLKDNIDGVVHIKQFDDVFRLIVDGESKFEFSAKDCDNIINIFTEIKGTGIRKAFE